MLLLQKLVKENEFLKSETIALYDKGETVITCSCRLLRLRSTGLMPVLHLPCDACSHRHQQEAGRGGDCE